jgi:hypothetical protein
MTVVSPLILDICFVDRRSGGCPPVSYPKKIDCHDITEILLKVALNTKTLTPTSKIDSKRG